MSLMENVGFLCVFLLSLHIIKILFRTLYNYVIGPNFGLNVDLLEMGKWAVVTGSTDGVGKAYAELLAKKGLNIVLISRTESKLQEVAENLESVYKVQTKIIVADFTENKDIYYNIEKQLTGLEIGVLVNNVGMSYAYPEYFLDITAKETFIPNIIQCNITSVTNMCKIVMPGMVERNKGVIVNISSMAARIPSPLLTIYSASKAYVEKFSEDLGTEYSKHGIIVQCILPGYVATKMSKIRSATWMAPSPRTYVKSALSTIGIQENTTGYFPHTMLIAVIDFLKSLSPSLQKWIVRSTLESIKARSLNKQQIAS